MDDRKDESYPFIKETIKQSPIDKSAVLKKMATAAICGIVFGLCAIFTILVCMPGVIKKAEQESKSNHIVQLTPAVNMDSAAETQVSGKETSEQNQNNNTEKVAESKEPVTVEHLQELYDMVKEIAKEPQKALVQVAGMTGDADLLNDSLLTYGNEGGIVFFKNIDAFYIVTTSDSLEKMEKFRVTFSNGKSAEGMLCGFDSRTRLTVLRVPMKNVDEKTRKEIPAVPLSMEEAQEQTQPAIAIGSPVGDMNSLIFGSITSVSGKLNIADAEYSLITTDMAAGQNGGALLDVNGRMMGIIVANKENEGSVIRAVSVAQIRNLLEMLLNGESICYVGIRGTTITEEQSEQLNIPQGVYVDRVEQSSPAMTAGIQSGDILYKLGDQKITTMKEYSRILQSNKPGDRIRVTLYRRNPFGEYVAVDLSVLIKEK